MTSAADLFSEDAIKRSFYGARTPLTEEGPYHGEALRSYPPYLLFNPALHISNFVAHTEKQR